MSFDVHVGHAGDKTKMRYHKIATCSWINDSNVGEACDVVELFKSDTLVCDSLHLRETCIMSIRTCMYEHVYNILSIRPRAYKNGQLE